MTLQNLADILCEYALRANLVNAAYFGPSIYEAAAGEVNQYPYIFISPTETSEVKKNTTVYRLTIYYVDRLLNDSENETNIFSVAIDTLANYLRQIKDIEGIVDADLPTVRNFTQSEKLQDRCAGGYCTVRIETLNDINCPIFYTPDGTPINTWLPAKYGGIVNLVTEEELDNRLKKYTLTKNFATINGSAITEGGDIVIEGGSGVTPDLSELSAQTVSNTYNIETLSGACGSLGTDLATLSAYTETLSGATPELIGSAITSAVTSANAYTDEKINNLTIPSKTSDLENDSGFITSAETKEQIESYNYTTSAVTENIINSALTGYYNSGQTNQAISAATQNMVTSETVRIIWTGSQAQYDLIDPKDPNTFYIIT